MDILRKRPAPSELGKQTYQKVGTIEELETRVDVLETTDYATDIDALDVRVTDLENATPTGPVLEYIYSGIFTDGFPSGPTFSGVSNTDIVTAGTSGTYTLTSASGIFKVNKIAGLGSRVMYDYPLTKYITVNIVRTSDNVLTMYVYDITNGSSNTYITNRTIDIRIFA